MPSLVGTQPPRDPSHFKNLAPTSQPHHILHARYALHKHNLSIPSTAYVVTQRHNPSSRPVNFIRSLVEVTRPRVYQFPCVSCRRRPPSIILRPRRIAPYPHRHCCRCQAAGLPVPTRSTPPPCQCLRVPESHIAGIVAREELFLGLYSQHFLPLFLLLRNTMDAMTSTRGCVYPSSS